MVMHIHDEVVIEAPIGDPTHTLIARSALCVHLHHGLKDFL